jgi:hypothetical protein
VVRVTDVDTLDDGAPYMVMELVDGTPLDALMDEAQLSVEPEQIMLRCLEAHRADRFASAREIMRALAPLATERARSVLLRMSDRPPPTSGAEPVSVSVTSPGSVSVTSPTLRPPKPTRSPVDHTLPAVEASGPFAQHRTL